MGKMLAGGTATFDNKLSLAIRKLLSGSLGGTWRSSPQKKNIWSHGRLALALAAISVYRFLGVDPPESAMVKRPRALTASVAVRITSSAAAWNRSCGVVNLRNSTVELTKFPLVRSSMWPRTGPHPADPPCRWG